MKCQSDVPLARTLTYLVVLTIVLVAGCRVYNAQSDPLLREDRPQPILQLNTQLFVDYAVISPDKKLLFVPSATGISSLWDFETGALIRYFSEGRITPSMSGAFSPDGRYIVTSSENAVCLWDVDTGKQLKVWKEYWPGTVSFSPDGKSILVATQHVYTLDVESSRQSTNFPSSSLWARYSADGRYILTGDDPVILFDAVGGQAVRRFEGEPRDYSSDGTYVITASQESVHVYIAASGSEVRRLRLAEDERTKNFKLGTAMISPDNQYILTVYYDPYSPSLSEAKQIASLWKVSTGQEISRYKTSLKFLSFGPDSKTAFVIKDGTVALADISSGTEVSRFVRRFSGYSEAIWTILCSDDGRYVWLQNSREENRVWDLRAGGQVPPSEEAEAVIHKLRAKVNPRWSDFPNTEEGHASYLTARESAISLERKRRLWGKSLWPAISADFSPDGKLVLVGGKNDLNLDENSAHLLEIDTKRERQRFIGHLGAVRSVAFSSNPNIVLTGGEDTTTRIWDAATGQELCKLISLKNDHWLVLDPEGRFDSDDIEHLDFFYWLMPDAPRIPLPVNVFMRDYYVPRLLKRILAGEKLKPVRNISKLNRAQPVVKITEVKPEGVNTVQVTVEVANSLSKMQRDAQGHPLNSGVFDVRLFRDEYLVGSSTSYEVLTADAKTNSLGTTLRHDEQELEPWRRTNEVRLDAAGKAMLTFHNIKLPSSARVKEVHFSAYAFNSDRVKSETLPPYLYRLSATKSRDKRRAYVITVGVDANQSGWTLTFAAKSAQDIQLYLSKRLSKEYEVVSLPLLSQLEAESPRVALKQATKGNIHTILDILAGRAISEDQRRNIPNVDELRAATPDDLVVLFISSHGYADPQGNFYVIPYDTGTTSGVTEDLLNDCLTHPGDQLQRCVAARLFLDHSVASKDLAEWWRDIDAGEIVMILDSCHSAAVPGREFRAGPLGDSGFGQLSYDKRMLLLMATQPDKTALSTLRVGQGRSLLSDALMNDSDYPQQILSEWLRKAEKLVPETYRKLYPEAREADIQLPLLLDFTKRQAFAHLN